MISYAQNYEDAVLSRLFSSGRPGRYIDVGAADPVTHSVTKHFYDRLWRGVNIEPEPAAHRALCKRRPGDVNLRVAAGRSRGRSTLWIAPPAFAGLSTLSHDLATKYQDEGLEFHPIAVEVMPLTEIIDAHPGPIDFLKIDAEGGERDVLLGADWTRHRPRVVLVEATVPNTQNQDYDKWENILLSAGYRFTLFDGINRFYVQEGDTEGYEALSVPANVFDDAEPYRWVRRANELNQARQAAFDAALVAEEYSRKMRDLAGRALHSARQLEAELASRSRAVTSSSEPTS